LLVVGIYGINFWLPSIIKATGVTTNLGVGLITAVPYAISVAVMVLVTRRAERTNEKRWHTTLAAVLAGLGPYPERGFQRQHLANHRLYDHVHRGKPYGLRSVLEFSRIDADRRGRGGRCGYDQLAWWLGRLLRPIHARLADATPG
jgi:hypothetical protein